MSNNDGESEPRSLFDNLEPPRLQIAERPTLLAQPLSSAQTPVKLADGQFHPAVAGGAGAVVADPPAPPVITTEPAPRAQLIFLYAIGLLVILFDQASKLFIESWLDIGRQYEIIPWLAPYFQLTHTINRGAAFGIFQNGGLVFSIVAVVVAIVIIVYNHQLPAGQNWLRLALGLQMGGALGNFIDRLRQGYVTDFLDINVESLIDFRYANWPIFNIADAAIVGGVIILIIVMIFMDEAALQKPNAAENEVIASAD